MNYSAAILILLAQFFVAPAFAKTPYDGTWEVAVVTKAGTCESLARYRLTVQDGKVFGPGDVSGRVTNDGYVRVSIGGSQGEEAALGKVIGPSFAAHEMPDVVSRLIEVYLERRHEDELFIDTVRRIGVDPFKERVYAEAHQA